MPAVHNIQVGAVEEKAIVVTPEVTISRSNERLPSILSTPAMIQFMEITAGKLIRPHLPDDWISVGVLVNVRHLAPTPEGAKVRIRATVTAVEDERITFSVEAFDEVEKIGDGTHTQALVELSRFLKRVNRKTP